MSTLAEARADVADDMLKHRARRAVWSQGFHAALDLMGVDHESAAVVSPHDPLLDAVADRRRAELAEVRQYRTRPRTAPEIAAQVAWSWRQVEREIAERWQVAG